ncbi:NCS2 family permease, partial [Anaerosporobacter sp.]|uniref:NCS2 family permease n=1 Tax=Anaerosporobacter sp. TaxID=1872529 RepID=UPI00286F0DEE
QAPGMGLNAFFVYTVCFVLEFTWQQALSMVFICGIINILITVTKVRKYIIKSIPKSLQNAISGGIGIFIAYIGLKNANILNFTNDTGAEVGIGASMPGSQVVPTLTGFSSSNLTAILAVIGLIITVVLLILEVKGAIFIGIILTTLLGIPMGLTNMGSSVNFSDACAALPSTFGIIFTKEGIPSLFNDASKIPIALITIFSFSLSDTFDTIGTFIGTGRRSGIFSEEDEMAMDKSAGFKSKMDKALFADATATSIGAIFGTSNTTTYVESAAGIGAGGRTGLTSVVVAICFAISAFFAAFVSAIPSSATAPALIIVGIMMLASFKEIEWDNLSEAIPAFFAGITMALFYSISNGIATGFIFYCIVKVCKKEAKEVHPIIWVVSGLFILNFILLALI